jgi:hypothetical protein
LSNPYVWEHTAATIAQLWQSKQDFQSSILDTSSSVGRAVIARWRRLNQYSGEEPRQAADYNPGISRFDTTFARLDWRHASLGLSQPNAPSAVAAKPKLEALGSRLGQGGFLLVRCVPRDPQAAGRD